jgi:hypothetical protein
MANRKQVQNVLLLAMRPSLLQTGSQKNSVRAASTHVRLLPWPNPHSHLPDANVYQRKG